MIYVDQKVLEGLEACRDSGYCNMFRYQEVVMWLSNNGYYAAACWVHENAHEEYFSGILEGFEIA